MVDWLGVAEVALASTRPDLPVVDRARCIATRHPSTTCVACVAACPARAISTSTRPLVDIDRCDGCGACTAACPTGALSSPWLEAAKRGPVGSRGSADAPGRSVPPAGTFAFRCGRAQPGTDGVGEAVIPCLGALRAGDLVLAIAEGAAVVRLIGGDCTACPRFAAVSGLDATTVIARDGAAALGLAGSIEVVTRQSEAPRPSPPGVRLSAPVVRLSAPAVTRRGLFGLARAQARRAVSDVARSTEPVAGILARHGEVPAWRRRLGRAARVATSVDRTADPSVRPPGLPVRLGVATVRVGTTCTGCGLCVLGCPFGLLVLAGDRAAIVADGCTACGLCVELCSEDAIWTEGLPVGVSAGSMSGERPGSTVAPDPPPCSDHTTKPVEVVGASGADLVAAHRLATRGAALDRSMRSASAPALHRRVARRIP